MEWFTELSWQIQSIMVAATLLIILLFFKPTLAKLIKQGLRIDKEDGLVIGGGYQETNKEWQQLLDVAHQTSRDIKSLTERMDDMDVTMMKVAICNEELPTAERCNIYELYKKKGYNSWVDQYFIDKIKPRIHKSIVREKNQ
jgi:hypothetical protein